MSVHPQDFTRRSFVWRELVALGADFGVVNDCAVALRIGDDDQTAARTLALADLSALKRIGFKGRGAADWLAAQGVVAPAASNQAARLGDGALACRLAPTEVLILDDESDETSVCDALAAAWPGADAAIGAYLVPRADANCWFAISGENAAFMFAKICAVDLRPNHFADGAIAQTSVARLNAIVARADIGATLVFHLLADIASASYMWAALLDAMREFAGRPVGLEALRALLKG